MNTRNLTLSAILLGIGTILHYLVPGLVGGMKPDFLLLMMFMALIINDDFKSCLAVSVLAGIISALTTSFPGGQIPSFLDKLASGIFFFLVYQAYARTRPVKTGFIMVLSALATFISGSIFAISAHFIAGLPEGVSLGLMIGTIVIPTALLTALLSGLLYPIMDRARKMID